MTADRQKATKLQNAAIASRVETMVYLPSEHAWDIYCCSQAHSLLSRMTTGANLRKLMPARRSDKSFYRVSIPDYDGNYKALLQYKASYRPAILPEDEERLEKCAADAERRMIALKAFNAGTRPQITWKIEPAYKLWPYQEVAVQYTLVNNRYINADPLGSGKTEMSLATAGLPGALPMLVVVPAHLAVQWRDRASRMFPTIPVYQLDNLDLKGKTSRSIFVVTYAKMVTLMRRVGAHPFRSIIFDEVHALRNATTMRGMVARRIASHTSVKYCIGCTASPIYNYASDVYNICSVIAPTRIMPKRTFLSLYRWNAGTDRKQSGQLLVSRTAELAGALTKRGLLIARTEEELGIKPMTVLQDYVPVEPSMSDEQIFKEATKRVSSDDKAESLRTLVAARALTSAAKQENALSYVEGLLEGGTEKIVVACFFRQMQDALGERLKPYGIRFVTGAESQAQKAASIASFINDPECRAISLSLDSGEGIDGLQHVCHHLVVIDLAWSPARHEQLIGRICRHGQTKPVHVHFVYTNAGTDPTVVNLLAQKKVMAKTFTEVTEDVVSKRILADMLARHTQSSPPRIRAIEEFAKSIEMRLHRVKATANIREYISEILTEATAHAMLSHEPWVWRLFDGIVHDEAVRASASERSTVMLTANDHAAIVLCRSMSQEQAIWDIYNTGVKAPHVLVFTPTGVVPSHVGATNVYAVKIDPISAL